jgi:hypothetical protein
MGPIAAVHLPVQRPIRVIRIGVFLVTLGAVHEGYRAADFCIWQRV